MHRNKRGGDKPWKRDTAHTFSMGEKLEYEHHTTFIETSWSCAGVNLPAKARFDCGWIMWLASKHVVTEKTNLAFCFFKIKV